MRSGQDRQSRLLYELCELVLGILCSPPGSRVLPPAAAADRRPQAARVSTSGLVSLLLGMSTALMLSGSVTFVIGFMLMPWVLGVAVVLYLLGVVSSLSEIGKSFFFPAPAPPPVSPRKEVKDGLSLQSCSLQGDGEGDTPRR